MMSFYVLTCILSRHAEMHFVYLKVFEGFGQHKLSFIFYPRWHGLVMFLECLDAFLCIAYLEVVFDQQMLRCIFWGIWPTQDELHFMYWPACDGFGKLMLRCILCLRWHWMALVKTCREAFVSSLAFDGFGQHKLRYIFSPRWHWMSLVNTCWDAYCVLAGMGGVW